MFGALTAGIFFSFIAFPQIAILQTCWCMVETKYLECRYEHSNSTVVLLSCLFMEKSEHL